MFTKDFLQLSAIYLVSLLAAVGVVLVAHALFG
jgi:hypothetical protein